MEKVAATIDINTGPLDELLARLREVGADPRQPLEEIGAVLEANVRTRFEEGKGPGGVPWIESLRVKLFGGQTLRKTGTHLLASVTHEVAGDGVTWGLTSAIAKIHQYGGTIVPKKPGGRLVFGALQGGQDAEGNITDFMVFAKKVVIPARPMVGFDDRDLRDTRDVLVDHLVKLARTDPDTVFA